MRAASMASWAAELSRRTAEGRAARKPRDPRMVSGENGQTALGSSVDGLTIVKRQHRRCTRSLR
jgi:hypothetical protein